MMVPGPLFVETFLQMRTGRRVRLELICNHQVLGLSVKEGRKEGGIEKNVGLKKRDWPQSHQQEHVEAQLQAGNLSIGVGKGSFSQKSMKRKRASFTATYPVDDCFIHVRPQKIFLL